MTIDNKKLDDFQKLVDLFERGAQDEADAELIGMSLDELRADFGADGQNLGELAKAARAAVDVRALSVPEEPHLHLISTIPEEAALVADMESTSLQKISRNAADRVGTLRIAAAGGSIAGSNGIVLLPLRQEIENARPYPRRGLDDWRNSAPRLSDFGRAGTVKGMRATLHDSNGKTAEKEPASAAEGWVARVPLDISNIPLANWTKGSIIITAYPDARAGSDAGIWVDATVPVDPAFDQDVQNAPTLQVHLLDTNNEIVWEATFGPNVPVAEVVSLPDSTIAEFKSWRCHYEFI